MINKNKLFAILGGMGPDASARLVARIVELSREIGKSKNSDDYPNFIMQNIPVPDFFDNPKLYDSGLKILKDSILNLEKLNPTYFAISCNTVHSLLPELQMTTKIPFLNLPEIVAGEINRKYSKIGLLATPLTYQTNIYKSTIKNNSVLLLEPSEKDKRKIGKVVHLILKGNFSKAKKDIICIADKLVKRGAEALILGCTELPLVFPKRYKVTVLSSIECLASEIVKRYYNKKS